MVATRTLPLLLAMAIASATSMTLRGQDAPARVLEIDAVALDRAGNPVPDLKPDDLEVWINGYRIPLLSLTAVSPKTADAPGRVIVLLLDDVTLDPIMVGRARDAANHFVRRMLPGDRLAVVSLNGGAMELTDDPARLRRRIDALRQSLGVIPIDRVGQHLLGAVDAVARSLREVPGGRKAVVAIGSAWLLDTPVPPAGVGIDLRREWYAALRSLAVAGAAYYVIDPRGVGASRQIAAEGFAHETGGHAFVNTNDPEAAVDRILRETASYYLIRVEDPPVGRKSDLRELEVRSLRSGITVRARRNIPGGA
jgi:VWFA-related protein